MLIISYENTREFSLVPQLSQIVPRSSIYHVRKLESSIVQDIKSPPLITDRWTVVIDTPSPQFSIIDELVKHDNIYVFLMHNMTDLQNMEFSLKDKGYEYNLIDRVNLSDEEKVTYIQSRLDVNEKTLKAILNKSKTALSLVKNVATLSVLDKVTYSSVSKYIPRSSTATFYQMLDYLLEVPNHKVSYARVVELIYNYRFSPDFLFKYLIEEINDYLKIYDFMIRGELTLDNLTDFKLNNNALKKISLNKCKKICNCYYDISYDKLYLLRSILETSPRTVSSLISIINLGG